MKIQYLPTSLLLLCNFILNAQSEIKDADNNTKVTTEFLPNENIIRMITNGSDRIFLGANAAGFTRMDVWNSNQCLFIGQGSGNSATAAGSNNTALGFRAGEKVTSGFDNTFVGQSAGSLTTTGSVNVAVGSGALLSNISGNSNIAIGSASLNQNTAGSNNVAVGDLALSQNQGTDNTCVGALSMAANTSGLNNTAVGRNAGRFNTTASSNTAVGATALFNTTTGGNNTALGRSALAANTTGSSNTAVGFGAGDGSAGNVSCSFFGNDADNTLTGSNLGNSTALGNGSRLTASNQVRVGNSSVTSIGGFVGFTNISDGRVKRQVKENVPGMDFIRQLRPVTYHLDVSAIDGFLGVSNTDAEAVKAKEQIVYTGFIAQEVEQAAQNAGYDFSGVDAPKNGDDLYGLRYAEFVVPMVKALQEQQAQIEALQSMVAQLLAAAPAAGSEMDLQVWPNPAREKLIVKTGAIAAGSTLALYGADGKLLRNLPARPGEQTLDLRAMPAGVYFVQVTEPGKMAVVRKVVVE